MNKGLHISESYLQTSKVNMYVYTSPFCANKNFCKQIYCWFGIISFQFKFFSIMKTGAPQCWAVCGRQSGSGMFAF